MRVTRFKAEVGHDNASLGHQGATYGQHLALATGQGVSQLNSVIF
jgi:hypothetical protein